jgi:hypothetical protein
MGVTRIYPQKSNTIASGAYRNLNSGQNAVTELWYGGGATDTAPERRNSISRFIMKFDLSELQRKLNSLEINPDLVTSYKLKMKNAIPRDRVLEPDNEFDRLNKVVAASFDLICFPINKYWEEGRGYDMFRENYYVKQKGNPLITGTSNWEYATSIEQWDEPGVYSDPTGSTAVTYYSEQHFDIGDEDIDMDITDIVNDWLSGGSENHGIGIAYRRDYELLSTDTRAISSFFTEKTNTAWKPYIEVEFDQVIRDDRNNVTNNRMSRLFLYTYSGNSLANYYSAGTVTIRNASNNTDVFTGLTPVQLEKGVYYVDVWMSGATRGQTYKDIWNDVTFNPGFDQQNIENTFTIKDNYFLNSTPGINEYSISVYGIDNGSIISTEEMIRVFCDLRVNYSTKEPSTPYELKYRLVLNNQKEDIPWTPVNQAMLNKCKQNYFLIDTSWLLHNQNYTIEFKIEELGTSRILPDKINFRVLRSF